jgi:hypothetical protein
MASKSVLTSALFDQLFSFTNELIAMYPDDPDFPLFSSTIRMLKMTNPSLIVKNIYDNTKSFEDKILSKNEEFFMEYSFSEFQKEADDINLFSKLKKYMKNMSAISKESVWKYIQNIFKLAKTITDL